MNVTRFNDDAVTLVDLLGLLARLHRAKDQAYGDAWRRRGEVIGIFANLARKYDRLEIGLVETRASPVEPLGDTVGDLCVYAGKYLTWLAETQPDAFRSASHGLDASAYEAKRGTVALERIFAVLGKCGGDPESIDGWGVEGAWERVQQAFGQLERALLAQSDADRSAQEHLSWSEKVALAWRLTEASACLLLHLGRRDRGYIESLGREIEHAENGQESG